MTDLLIQKLFLLYQSKVVSTNDPNETEVLQLAQAVADDLTEEEFGWLFSEVFALQQQRDARSRASAEFKLGGGDIDNFSVQPMTPKEYQERLWELPDLVRAHEKPFVPSRLADGTPIDIDKNAPKKTQEEFRQLHYSQVKHDPKLRDAWHAAQSGKLEQLLTNGDLWQSFTDTRAISDSIDIASINRESLSAPLRLVLAMIDSGSHLSDLSPEIKQESSKLSTNLISRHDPGLVTERLLAKDPKQAEKWQQMYIRDKNLENIPTKTPIENVIAQDPDATRKWVGEIREYHEMTSRQMMVDKQLRYYEESAPKSSSQNDYLVPPIHASIPKGGDHSKENSPLTPPAQPSETSLEKPVNSVDAKDFWKTVVNKLPADQNADADKQQAGTGIPIPPPPQPPEFQPFPAVPNGSDQQSNDVETTPKVDPKPFDPKSFWDSLVDNTGSSPDHSPGIVDNPLPSSTGGFTDTVQNVLDGLGVADPTPVADGINVAISLVRAMSNPREAGTHLTNAAVSAVSMFPYLGDLAKVGKYGFKGFKGFSKAGKSAPESIGDTVPAAGGGGIGGVIGGLLGGLGGSDDDGSDNSKLGSFAIPIGAAIAAAVGDSIHRVSSFAKLYNPVQHTGDSFDSFKSMSERGMDTFNTIAPSTIKWGPFGIAIGFATRQLNKWVDWLQKVEQSGNSMLQANRELANYSGTIAGAYAQLDADRVRREMSKAASMSGPLAGLAKNQSDFEAAKQDLFQPFEQLAISVQSSMTWLATQTIKVVDSLESISEIIEWWYGKAETDAERSALESAIREHKIELKDKLQ